MPQMNNLNDDNKNNEPGDRNHFSEYFDSIIEGLKCHATIIICKEHRRAQKLEAVACGALPVN